MILIYSQVNAEIISDFKSDGCSHFPEGTLKHKSLWCACCINHDLAYWQGGSRLQKQQADQTLRECVLNKTGNQLLANTMYYGVTLGGLPIYPTWYRWGFGWLYGRGFKTLSNTEQQQVNQKIIAYHKRAKNNHCNFK